MTALYSAVLSAATAAAIGGAAVIGGRAVPAAVGICVLCLALGWGDLLRLPHRPGTAVLVGVLGSVALLVAVDRAGSGRPLMYVPSLLAVAVLVSFGHELLRRDGRGDLVESITGTLTGQLVAVLAMGWVLLAEAGTGSAAIVMAVSALAAARLVGALPLPVAPAVTAWAGIGCAVAAALVAAVIVAIDPATAVPVGIGVAGAGIALDRLLVDPRGGTTVLGLLARSAAPVAAAGTISYAVVRIAQG